MRYSPALLVCILVLFAATADGQNVKPIQYKAGMVLSFHLQTRLQADAGDTLNELPSGAVLSIEMLDDAQRDANADGVPFRGIVTAAVSYNGDVLIHSAAEVQGIQILLRSRNHPEGFRYELLITGLTDQGRSQTITAFFDPSLAEDVAVLIPAETAGPSQNPDTGGALRSTSTARLQTK